MNYKVIQTPRCFLLDFSTKIPIISAKVESFKRKQVFEYQKMSISKVQLPHKTTWFEKICWVVKIFHNAERSIMEYSISTKTIMSIPLSQIDFVRLHNASFLLSASKKQTGRLPQREREKDIIFCMQSPAKNDALCKLTNNASPL